MLRAPSQPNSGLSLLSSKPFWPRELQGTPDPPACPTGLRSLQAPAPTLHLRALPHRMACSPARAHFSLPPLAPAATSSWRAHLADGSGITFCICLCHPLSKPGSLPHPFLGLLSSGQASAAPTIIPGRSEGTLEVNWIIEGWWKGREWGSPHPCKLTTPPGAVCLCARTPAPQGQ